MNAADENGQTALMLAVGQYDPGVVEYLLQHGAKINVRDKQGRTALLVAIDAPDHYSYDVQYKYTLEIAKMLVKFGANVNTRANNGDSPLKAAYRRGHKDIVPVLEKAGARE